MKLISVKDLQAYLEKTDSSHDDLLETFIEGVSQRIETFLNRKLKKEERTKVFNGGKRIYLLDAYPIDTGETITVDIDGITSFTEGTDYFIWDTQGMIEFASKVSDAEPRILAITYTGGFTETNGVLEVPDDIKRACTMQCGFEFRRRKDMGISSVSSPDGNITVNTPAALLPEVRRTLLPYVYRRIA